MVVTWWQLMVGVAALVLVSVDCQEYQIGEDLTLKTQGSCPVVVDNKTTFCAIPITDSCRNDSDCDEDVKCCDNPCGKYCANATIPFITEKPGICPALLDARGVSCITSTTDECYQDADCPGDDKCCVNPCGKYCAPPSKHFSASKPGICPTPFDPHTVFCARNSKDWCSYDVECSGNLKCCSNPCGKYCATPHPPAVGLHIPVSTASTSPGACPTAPDPLQIVCSTPITDSCQHDNECREGLKCCSNPCGKYCAFSVRPEHLSIARNEFCPVPPDPRTTLCSLPIIDSCATDEDCDEDGECCDNPCGKYCAGTIEEIPYDKPGFCPLIITFGACSTTNNQCKSDIDCRGRSKCCRSKCGTVCRFPKNGWHFDFHSLI
ncbi:hypothetical protein SNE40_007212 [Patella caerulea]|uniref:WAP domain-containing protein n=1 Tax=Patella caerulea TaxID=87958 RepID=A0AAN8Q212_PATCE